MTLRNVRNMRQATMDFGPQAGFDFGGQAGFEYAPPDTDWVRAEAERAARRRQEREAEAQRKREAEARRQADRERAEREERSRQEESQEERARQRRHDRCGVDPWSVLGVARDASPAEVRAAWASLCKQFHPDAVGGDAERIKSINVAYNRLKGKR